MPAEHLPCAGPGPGPGDLGMRPHGPGLISLRVPALSPLPGLEGGWGALLSTELREHVTVEGGLPGRDAPGHGGRAGTHAEL